MFKLTVKVTWRVRLTLAWWKLTRHDPAPMELVRLLARGVRVKVKRPSLGVRARV